MAEYIISITILINLSLFGITLENLKFKTVNLFLKNYLLKNIKLLLLNQLLFRVSILLWILFGMSTSLPLIFW